MVPLRPETVGKTANTSRKGFAWQLKVRGIKPNNYIQKPTLKKGLYRVNC